MAAGVEHKTKDYSGTTGAVPSGMPKSTVMMYDGALASRERWLIGAVENSTGGCTSEACYFDGTWWLFAMDRQGRIVWYYADPATNDVSSFPRQRVTASTCSWTSTPLARAGRRAC